MIYCLINLTDIYLICLLFFDRIYVGRLPLNVTKEELINVYAEPKAHIDGLRYTPSAAFGSCRYKLKDVASHREQYLRLLDVFDAHNIGYFLYNGGGDSQDTAHKISKISAFVVYPVS